MATGGTHDWNEEEDDKYTFSPGKGLAVIIVNNQFDGYSTREGSELDKIKLEKTFTQLGFKMLPILDLHKKELMDELSRISREDVSDIDCLAVVISSHGDEGQNTRRVTEDYIIVRDGQIKTSLLVDIFTDRNCPALEGKPRLFFIQACRGKRLDSGQEVVIKSETADAAGGATVNPQQPSGSGNAGGNSGEVVVRTAPCHADFLIMYATPPGHYAFRKEDEGSIFISHLCKYLMKTDGPLSLTQRLTRVVAEVSRFESYSIDSKMNKKKQSPMINCMLTKGLDLLPLGSQSS